MILSIFLGSLVGLSLGLTGGGGSIFAVPLLVYGLDLTFRESVALSLAIVGTTALYGAALQARRGLVIWGAGAVLGLGGIITAPIGAYLGTLIPEQLSILMFAGLMFMIGGQMLRGGPQASLSGNACTKDAGGELSFSWPCAFRLLAAGTLTGMLSGIFGVGGGFLLVPALLLVAGISIERAMATSLVSIALISTSGFISNAGHLSSQSLGTATIFLVGALLGMTIGARVKHHLPAAMLRRIFGAMVIATGSVMVVHTVW